MKAEMFGASHSAIRSLYSSWQLLKELFATLIIDFNRFEFNAIPLQSAPASHIDGVSSHIPLLAFIAWERFG